MEVMYGADYPYVPMNTQAVTIRKLDLSEEATQAIESGEFKYPRISICFLELNSALRISVLSSDVDIH